jgi:NAD(P)-dependent dehydrogenase (short-subunit alcohol dehydrogenase family)
MALIDRLANSPIGLLADKAIVVTGGGSGIGRVMAQVCIAEGARVLVADFSGAQDAIAEELGPNAVPCSVDIRVEDQVAAMYDAAVAAFGSVEGGIHVAGNPGSRRGEEISLQEYQEITEVHLKGTLLCCKHAIRVMQPNRAGSVVNFSSVAALGGFDKNSTAYAAAKAGINSLTKTFALHHGRDGIRFNSVLPGFTMSDKNKAVPPEALAVMTQRSALGRAGTAEEQAQLAAFLVSDRASFVTGAIIPVDGAWSARLA